MIFFCLRLARIAGISHWLPRHFLPSHWLSLLGGLACMDVGVGVALSSARLCFAHYCQRKSSNNTSNWKGAWMRATEQWALHLQYPADCGDKPMLMTCRKLACVGAGVGVALSYFSRSDGGWSVLTQQCRWAGCPILPTLLAWVQAREWLSPISHAPRVGRCWHSNANEPAVLFCPLRMMACTALLFFVV